MVNSKEIKIKSSKWRFLKWFKKNREKRRILIHQTVTTYQWILRELEKTPMSKTAIKQALQLHLEGNIDKDLLVDMVLERLERLNIVDDKQLAQKIVNQYQNYGDFVIQNHLKSYKLSKMHCFKAMRLIPSEEIRARKVLDKRHYSDSMLTMTKKFYLTTFLEDRGFDSQVIEKIVKEYLYS